MAPRLSRVRDLVRRSGFDVGRYPVPMTLPGHLKKLITHFDVDVVLDIGANFGQFAQGLRDVSGFTGRIESFEPTSATHATLAGTTAGDPNWNIHQLALGSTDGEADLHTFDSSDWNSLLARDLEHLDRGGWKLEDQGLERVQVRTLDGLWDDLVRPGESVLLKSDTQGNDLEVLAGAGSRLDSVAVLLLEASVLTFYDNEPDLRDTLGNVADLGFTPSGIFPVTARRGTFALATVDVCFVRTPPAVGIS